MRLDRLWVGDFKNLHDLTVDFDEGFPYTVLVGENGSGKSNLLEALTVIFRQLDFEDAAEFGYELRYECREHEVDIKAEKDGMPVVRSRTNKSAEFVQLSRREFMVEDDRGPLYRPAFVFGYYSGPSDRMATLYEPHRERFYQRIIKALDDRPADVNPTALRRLFYAETIHGQFALLAFFMEPDDDDDSAGRKFLREHMQIEGLDSVLLALKKPPWNRKGGDPRFWQAVGDVQVFLDHAYEAAELPCRMPRRIQVDLRRNPEVENLYLFLADEEALARVYAHYESPYEFFIALESTHLSKLLGEVRTRVRMTPGAGGGEVTYRDLSEGEQQLLLVLGLIKFTAQSEALFLLDEPDTHLNPAWSTQYLDFLGSFISDSTDSQIVMSTHDPLVFSGLTRSQVRIFRRDEDGRASVEQPLDDPRGMGIQAILASDFFRLPSGGIDSETLREVERQRRLAMKEDLNTSEKAELRELSERLDRQPFWKQDVDPLYQLFLEHFVPRYGVEGGELNTPATQVSVEEIRRRDALAEQIAAEIAGEIDDSERQE